MIDTIEFKVPMKAFSINAAYYKTRAIKTPACKEWESLLEHHLAVPLFAQFSAGHAAEDTYSIEIHTVYPRYKFYNSTGAVSAKTFDISNTEKLFIDVLFGSVLQINDKHIVSMVSTKSPGIDYAIKFKIERLKSVELVPGC